jgi:spermidine synthase
MHAESRPGSAIDRHAWPLYLLFLLSGGAALVYQVMWARSFGLIFGSTTRAASVVLAAFFLGMAIGNLLGSRWAVTRSRSLRVYGLVEFAIAVGAVLVICWLQLFHSAYPALYRFAIGQPHVLVWIQLGLALFAMAPPCIAMGATLPLMSRAVLFDRSHVGRRLGWVYALNTIGGTVGVLASGFLMPVTFGVRNSMLLAAALNVLVAAGALLLARRWSGGPLESATAECSSAPRHRVGAEPVSRLLWFAAIVSGLATIALEVLYTRLLVHAMDASVFSFAIVLAVFLVCLAMGSAFVSVVVDRLGSPWVLLALASALSSAAIVLSPAVFEWAWEAIPRLRPEMRPVGLLLLRSFLIIGPSAVAAGMILPTVWKVAVREVGEAGVRVGRLTSVNTLSGVAGALLAGFVAVPKLGMGASFALVGALYGALAIAIALRSEFGSRRWPAALAIACALLGLASLRSWEIVPVRLLPNERLIAYYEGEGATVSVTDSEELGGVVRKLTVNSSYGLGNSHRVAVPRSQGRLALLLHGRPRSVAFIGLATGITASSIQDFPSITRALALEILPGVVEAARAFASSNGNVLDDPRLEVLPADGRNHLFGIDQNFDVIVGDLFIPWHSGTGYLYTVEHFANVGRRLSKGGVFVQWLQANQLTVWELQVITASFVDAFDDAELWLNRTARNRHLIGLVGRSRDLPVAAAQQPVRIDDMERVCGVEALRGWSRESVRNTDDFPIIEFSAGLTHGDALPGHQQRMSSALDELRALPGC